MGDHNYRQVGLGLNNGQHYVSNSCYYGRGFVFFLNLNGIALARQGIIKSVYGNIYSFWK